MTGRGRHASNGTSSFYRDLAVMIGGIVLVGAAVFFVLILLADGPTTTTTEGVVTTPTTVPAPSTSTSGATSTSIDVTTTTTIPQRDPSEVRVLVLNSMGLAGAAGRLTERLAELGYQTLPADDYTPEQDPSRIWFREGFSAEANVLLSQLPDALVESIPEETIGEGADIVIVLGTGYEE
ncbi:MAG: LytR C-terminal domain-containing protein [Actinobacteria bacterium]|nr:LytR C-terminal domain-containing protein [Actinomycetota bacterium]